jgi:hypothetical protein
VTVVMMQAKSASTWAVDHEDELDGHDFDDQF